jgi:hypothetical protein
MLRQLFLWWCYECQRRWDMNLTSALARVEFESAVDYRNAESFASAFVRTRLSINTKFK